MNKLVKRIAVAAMAFTVIGSGSAIATTVNPTATNTIVASAVYCPAHNGIYTEEHLDYICITQLAGRRCRKYHKHIYTRCAVCGKILKDRTSTYYEFF